VSSVQDWIGKAEEDLETATYLIERSENHAAFLLQQSAEKAMKASLLDNRGEYPFIHDLVELGKEVGVPEKFLDSFSELNPVYYATRYPDSTDQKVENVESLENEVRVFLEWTRERLNE